MKIYLSYAERDSTLTQQISQLLRSAGLEPVGVLGNLLPGDNWAEILGNDLATAEWCVFLLTKGSFQKSDRLRAELQFVLGDARFRDRVISIAFATDSVTGDDVPWVLVQHAHYRQVEMNDAKEAARAIVEIVAQCTESVAAT